MMGHNPGLNTIIVRNVCGIRLQMLAVFSSPKRSLLLMTGRFTR